MSSIAVQSTWALTFFTTLLLLFSGRLLSGHYCQNGINFCTWLFIQNPRSIYSMMTLLINR